MADNPCGCGQAGCTNPPLFGDTLGNGKAKATPGDCQNNIHVESDTITAIAGQTNCNVWTKDATGAPDGPVIYSQQIKWHPAMEMICTPDGFLSLNNVDTITFCDELEELAGYGHVRRDSSGDFAITYTDLDGEPIESRPEDWTICCCGEEPSGDFIPMAYLDTDGTLAANSDAKVASQKATKTYADTKIPKSIVTTEGDILVATAPSTVTRLPVGTDTYVLSVDVSLPGKLKWIPAGSGGAVSSVFGRSGGVTAMAGDYTAAQVTNVPAGGIVATDVQAAITELDIEKQPVDATLTALAGFNTNGLLTQTATDTFAGRTLVGTSGKVDVANGNGVSGNPSVTLPNTVRITTAIADDNGNEYFVLSSTASAVNQLTITNAATANNPKIAASGDDTNVSLLLDAKGTGIIRAQQALVTDTVALTDAANIATDASLGNFFRVTLGGNRMLASPTNPTDGQTCVWEIIQDATGSRTLSYDSAFALTTGVANPVLNKTAAAHDFITAIYNSTTSKWYITEFDSQANEWQELARVQLTANATSMSATIAARKYLRVRFNLVPSGAITGLLRFNGDSTSTYSYRYSLNLAAVTPVAPDNSIPILINTGTLTCSNVLEIINITAQEKLVSMYGSSQGGAGAGNAPSIEMVSAKWANTTAQIISLVISTGTNNFAAGSGMIIEGHD